MKTFRYLNNTAILRLDVEKCIGCGNCVQICPHRVFTFEAGKAVIQDHNGCMECGACSTNCPAEAIYVNPDDGCGCAAYIINSWFHKLTRGKSSPGGC